MSTSIWHIPEREELRKTVRAFAEREVLPNVAEWEKTCDLPRELHRKAGDAGLLGAGLPEAVGGGGGDGADAVIICEEMHYAGSPGGVFASLFTCGITVPHMIASGDQRLIDTYVRPTLRGDKIGALAITEPGGGSDVGHLTTKATRDGRPGRHPPSAAQRRRVGEDLRPAARAAPQGRASGSAGRRPARSRRWWRWRRRRRGDHLR
ncbi:MAG: acyl-CoA dehydrogenase, partial [Mycobacterium sp.]|nr:acyl-CoA dehydrogenase [Mycobacterium sp.]